MRRPIESQTLRVLHCPWHNTPVTPQVCHGCEHFSGIHYDDDPETGGQMTAIDCDCPEVGVRA